ncbi:MAG: tyrosine-type recombinase/integrase [Polyangia bacterium]
MKRYTLDAWQEGYLDYLRDVRKLSHRTLVDLRCTLGKISRSMEQWRPGTPLWKLSLDDFLHWLNEARVQGQVEKVLAKELSHLRGLLDYAWRSGRADRNVLDGFSLQDSSRRVEPRSLTLDEAERLVRACPRKTTEDRRRRLVVLLLYGCGLRTSELAALDVSDVNVERQEILIRHGKGGRQRTIPVPAVVWTELLSYLMERGGKRGPLFRTQARQARIAAREIGDIVREAASRGSIEWPITPRTLRHTFGTHLMDAGVDLGVIASLMGHRSPQETGVYLHVLSGKTEAAVRVLFADQEESR